MLDKVKELPLHKRIECIVAIINVIYTVTTLILGIMTLDKTIKHESELTQKATMLEHTIVLPNTMQSFIRQASLTLANLIAFENEGTDDYWQSYMKHNDEQSALLDKLFGLIVAYGLEEVISLFSEFSEPLRRFLSLTQVELGEFIDVYYPLPLLMSVIKYETTGEIVNTRIIFEFLMPEFETITPSIMNYFIHANNELVEEYDFDKQFLGCIINNYIN